MRSPGISIASARALCRAAALVAGSMLALVPVAYGGQGVLAKAGVDAGNGNCPEGARDGIDGAARLAGMLGQQEVTVTVEARDSHGNVIRFETEPDAAPAPANRDASACTA